MVYKVFGKTGKSELFWKWSRNALKVCIDGVQLPFKDVYVFNYKEIVQTKQFQDIPAAIHKWMTEQGVSENFVYMYSNYDESEVQDLIDLLEQQDFNTVLFLQE